MSNLDSGKQTYKDILNKDKIGLNKDYTYSRKEIRDNQKGPKKKLKILIISLISLLILTSVIILVIFLLKKPPTPPTTVPSTIKEINPPNTKKKLESEPLLSFKTEKNQYNRIYVNQNYTETTVTNGKELKLFLNRITIYDIYVLSVNEPNENEKHLYSKMYTCVVSIAKQCTNNKGQNCEPKTVIELTDEKIPKGTRIRNLQQNIDFSNIPIPFCIFNITDNNAIISIKCPNSLNEGKMKEIVLDLYFYRTVGVKRVENNNITITKIDLDEDKIMVREINGGICKEDESGFYSFCSTDSNTTKDKEENLLIYDEICTTNITKDENNYYLKNKMTHLIDITNKNNTSIIKEKINNLLEKINPYMHYYELTSHQQLEEIYDISMNNKLPENKRRRLENENSGYIKEENVFEYKDLCGATIALNMIVDSSLNTNSMKANGIIKYNEEKEEDIVTNNQESLLTDILNELEILSDAGNHLANNLYNNIKYDIVELMENMQSKISSLNKKLSYANITKIFDTSYDLFNLDKIPKEIVNESNQIYEKIKLLFTELSSINSKEKFDVIKNNIHIFIMKSNELLYNLSNNLRNLGNSMSSEGHQLTKISMYYLKKDFSIYMNIVKQAQEILENYFKSEANYIISNVNEIKEEFEENLLKSSEDERKMVISLSEKLGNKTFIIENVTDELIEKTIDNLYNSTTLITDISNKIKDLINNELDLNGEYFLSENEIKVNNISFSTSISKALDIADILDNDKLIDKKFDEIMSYFRNNFSSILIDMTSERENQFTIEEDALKYTLFKNDETKKIKNKFNSFTIDAINEIKNENEEYKNKINETIMKFMKENEDELNSIISDLYILFSNESLKELEYLYDLAFNSSLEKIVEDIKFNENLAKNYFGDMETISYDKIIEYLKSFQQDSVHIPPNIDTYIFQGFQDFIWLKYLNKDSLNSKYNTFKENLEYSKNYINNDLYLDLKNNYKYPIIKLRKALQTIKNNKLNEKYIDFPEIGFNNHKNVINILFNRLDNFLSDELYNNRYINYKKENEYKYNETEKMKKTKEYIDNSKKNIINNNKYEMKSNLDNDYCVWFYRFKSYLCSNGKWTYGDYDDYFCFPVSQSSNNHNNLIEISINLDKNMINFNNKIEEFYNLINEKIDKYNSKIESLKSSLSEIEEQLLNKNNVFDYITSFNEEINSIFDRYYKDQLIKSSYEHYKNITERNVKKVLNKSTYEWLNAFESLEKELNENKNNFTSSINEFQIMAASYYSTITQNITKYNYDSIISHLRNEFNYTISYYYNYLLRLANSTHNYLINRILTNQNYVNYIVEQRINLINELFSSFIENITKSQEESLTIEKQINVLGVAPNNFFKVNNILENNLIYEKDILSQKISSIKNIKNGIKINQYTATARYYLENIECGKQIKNLYNLVFNKNKIDFIILKEDGFKDIISNNWVLNFDELTNDLEVKLYNLRKEINEEFKIYKNNYVNILENELNFFLTKEGIIEKTNELYNDGIKIINDGMKKNIISNISLILNNIKMHLSNEIKRISSIEVSFNDDTSVINNTIKGYKKEIITKLNNSIIFLLTDFYNSIKKNFYEDYIIECLNKFYEELKYNSIIEGEYKLLNSSFNFNNMINNILLNLQNEYKTIARKQIEYKHNLKSNEIYNIINLESIGNFIDNELSVYKDNLIKVIKKKIINDAGYGEYNLNNTIKNDINNIINDSMNNIEIIINSTKGENYKINVINNWKTKEEFDFTKRDNIYIKADIIEKEIKDNFIKKFYNEMKKYEEKSINNLIEESIIRNFNNLLGYLIPTSGKLFFERIVKYNENFKIMSLYDNLRYSITQTLSYFIMLTASSKITAFPKDLKTNLYNLNNLSLLVESNNAEILKNIDNKINDFNENIKEYILNLYLRNFNEFLTEQKFSQNIITMINLKFQQISTILQNICTNILKEYLKEPFILSYKKVMNEKTKEMLMFANEQKEILRKQVYDKFTLNPDEILNKVNEYLNLTERSITEYYNFFNSFKINNEFIEYLNNYGENNIKPVFSNLIFLINNAKIINNKNELKNLDKSSKRYEDLFNIDLFTEEFNNIHSFLKEKYIDNITNNIELYDAKDYSNRLKKEKSKYEKRKLRFLEGNETEKDIEEKYRERIADKAIDMIFQNISKVSNSLKTLIEGGNEFDNLDANITDHLDIINKNYYDSSKIIKDKKEKGIFDDELYNTFNNRLIELHNMTKNYYIQIKNDSDIIREYLKESIYNIYNLLKECDNITYITFAEEYKQIKNKFLPYLIDKNSNLKDENYKYCYQFHNDNTGQIQYDIEINSNKKAFFYLDLIFNGPDFHNPEVVAKIINLSGPKNLNINKISGTSNSHGDSKRNIFGNFGAANYTMIITKNTQNKKINITNIINIQEYSYNIKDYQYVQKESEEEPEIFIVNGIVISYDQISEPEYQEIEVNNDNVIISSKTKSSTVLI